MTFGILRITAAAVLFLALAGSAQAAEAPKRDDAYAAGRSADIEAAGLRMGGNLSGTSALLDAQAALRRYKQEPSAASRAELEAAVARLQMEASPPR